MKHYDGPAFFRRYSKPDQHNKLERPTTTKGGVSHRVAKQATTRLEPAPKKPVTIKKPAIGRTDIPLESVGNQVNWTSSQPFRVSRVPRQLPKNRIQKREINYSALKQQFKKPDSSVLVFSSGLQGQTALQQPVGQPVSSLNHAEANHVTQDQGPKPTLPRTTSQGQGTAPLAGSSVTESSNNKLSTDELAAKKRAAMERLKARALAKHQKKQARQTDTHLDHSTNAEKTTPTQTQTNHQGQHTVPQQPSVAHTDPQPVSEPKRGLGHSLGDILNEEETSRRQSDLALFQDKPELPKQAVEDVAIPGYQYPSTALLNPPVQPDESEMDEWIQHQATVLDETLKAFHVEAHVVDWTVGPTVTQFQVSLALGVKVNKITNLTDDLKLALAAKDIRIEAPIPGRTTVGIEIPNLKTRPVMLSEVVQSEAFKKSASPLTVALGVDLFGQPQVTDLRKMPHGLIAGATGSGKSVFINSLLLSLLYKATPAELRLILIDPKAVELAPYDKLPHLLSPVISDPKAAAAALKWAVTEMDERYERLAAGGVRNIEQFNERAELTESYGLKMPYIVIVIDELADLMMTASSEVQDYIVRITQKARAAGIHLLIATQRPSVDIVTGVIKNNIPTRVAFMVSSQIDSRTILDTAGAERLLGRGDMLYLGNGAAQAIRLQGTFVNDEVDRVTDFVRKQGEPHYAFDPDGLLKTEQVAQNQDELMPEVLDFIVNESTVSTSKLQRVFSIGYNRAANLIDTLENKSYISAQNGSKPRDVFITPKQLSEMRAPWTD